MPKLSPVIVMKDLVKLYEDWSSGASDAVLIADVEDLVADLGVPATLKRKP